MSFTYIAGIIASTIVIALIVSSVSYNRQKAIAQRRRMIAQHKKEAGEYRHFRDFILATDPEYPLLYFLQKRLVESLENALELVPQDNSIQTTVNSEQEKLRMYRDNTRHQAISQVMKTEDELNQSRRTLSQLSKAIEIQKNAGKLPLDQSEKLAQHIKSLSLFIEVASHEHQASTYASAGDIVMYQTHLKQARDALKKAPLESREKNQRIKAITAVLNEVKRTNKIVPLPTSELKEHEVTDGMRDPLAEKDSNADLQGT